MSWEDYVSVLKCKMCEELTAYKSNYLEFLCLSEQKEVFQCRKINIVKNWEYFFKNFKYEQGLQKT